jgi:hypothetical protein
LRQIPNLGFGALIDNQRLSFYKRALTQRAAHSQAKCVFALSVQKERGGLSPSWSIETVENFFGSFPPFQHSNSPPHPQGYYILYYNFSIKGANIMAIYHLSIKIISRGKGKSAVAGAAYRAGEKITNEYDGITHDYSRKRGIVHTQIMLPVHAPPEYSNRAVLWNAVEKNEKASNSQLAREIELALPVELSRAQNISLVNEYCKKHFVNHGMVADIAIHDTGNGNPHAHILLTMRPFNDDKSWGIKERKNYALDEDGERIPLIDPKTGQQKADSRNRKQWKREYVQINDWNFRGNAEEWRESWSKEVNTFLEQKNINERIDHKSFKRQGKDEQPTIHLGVAADRMEQKGIQTERGNHNRKVKSFNDELRQLKARLTKLDDWLKEEMQKPEIPKQPMLYDVVQDILNRQAQAGKSQHYQNIYNLKSSAKMLNFLSSNDIKDMAGLERTVKSMHGKLSDVRYKLKPVERRLKTLNEHIKQSENYKKYKPTKRQYDELHAEYSAAKKTTGLFARRNEEKARVAYMEYYENHRPELFQFDTAEKYLKEVMQERFNPKKLPPIKKWKEEYKTLTAEKDLIYREYYNLKDEVKEVEQIKRSVDILMKEQPQRNEPVKRHEMEM